MGNLSKEIMKLSVVVLAIASALPAIEQDQASSVLSRHARASNKRGFEEVKSGNLERECIEETCDQHELFEVYDDENAPEIFGKRRSNGHRRFEKRYSSSLCDKVKRGTHY